MCRICGSERLAPRFHVAFPHPAADGRVAWPIDPEPAVAHWSFSGCTECGVVFANPMPSDEDVRAFYTDSYEPNAWEQIHYVQERPDTVRHWSSFAEKLTRLNGGPGRLLEIGPAAGHLLRAARGQGWTVLGVEATPKFANVLRRRELPVHQGVIATLGDTDPFDLVAMIDVLEHLVDPIGDLRRCAARLRPGGRVVVATCDIGSLAAHYYSLKWRMLIPSHTFYWTKRSLRLAMKKAGLIVTDIGGFAWWDPAPANRRLQWAIEFGKLVARAGLQKTWMPVLRRSRLLQESQTQLTRGWLPPAQLEHKVGRQAVMSDVTLVVGQIPS